MAQHRSDITFDDTGSGSICIGSKKNEAESFIYQGQGTYADRALCRVALKLYDLGAQHKAEEVRKVLGVR